MANVFVKVRGPFLKGGYRTVNPGSVVSMSEEVADEFVNKRGMGDFHPGPESEAPPPDGSDSGIRADGTLHASPGPEGPPLPADTRVERADLGERISRAERASARPQRASS